MAASGDDREQPRVPSEEKLEVAVEFLKAVFRQKHGNRKHFGDSTVTLTWKGGEIDLVTITDGATHR